MPATLLSFTEVNDAAAATTKKLEKQAILADYFRTLDEADLRLAVRFAGGRPFAATDERVLNVGGAIVWDATIELVGLDPAAYHDLIVRSGEIGEAIAKIWPSSTGFQPVSRGIEGHDRFISFDAARHGLEARATEDGRETPVTGGLTLHHLAIAFDALAATGVVERKRAILLALLSRCTTGREAAYVTKIIFGDLRTGVQEGVLQAAVAKAFDRSLAAVQRCQLLVGDLDEVAILAKRNALDSASFRLFHPIQFMLATPQETADDAAATLDGRAFWAEDKLDGIRAQIHKSADRVAIYTRTMDRTDASFPEVVDAVAKLPGEFVLDGEIVPYRDGCVLPFAHVQKRLGRKVLTPKMLRENPVAFVAFDVLYHGGELLMDHPLRTRRQRLTMLAGLDPATPPPPLATDACQHIDAVPAPAVADTDSATPPLLTTHVTEVTTAEKIAETFAAARDRRNEGIVLKDPESIYSPGRRGKMWLKLKTHLPTFDCVVTAAEYGHGKRRSVLSDYTFAVWTDDPGAPGAALVNVGKAYSGVTDEEIAQLTALFLTLSRGQYGRVHAVEPKIVLEIACDQIQKSARHASGYALRFPRIKRIRWDKRPEDADRLARIVEIYESSPNFAKPLAKVVHERAEPTLFD